MMLLPKIRSNFTFFWWIRGESLISNLRYCGLRSHPNFIRQLKQECCSLPKRIRQPCWIFTPSEGVLIIIESQNAFFHKSYLWQPTRVHGGDMSNRILIFSCRTRISLENPQCETSVRLTFMNWLDWIDHMCWHPAVLINHTCLLRLCGVDPLTHVMY